MHRLLTALAVLALAIAPGAAIAKNSGKKGKKPTPRAKVLRATIKPAHTDALYAGIGGKAQLVDGKKNDKVSIHVRNLKPLTPYLWHVHEFAAGVTNPCAPGAAQGPIVTAFNYRQKSSNASGNLNSTGRSKTFRIDPEKRYYVNVHAADGTVLACGVLKGKKAKKAKKRSNSKSKGKRPATRKRP